MTSSGPLAAARAALKAGDLEAAEAAARACLARRSEYAETARLLGLLQAHGDDVVAAVLEAYRDDRMIQADAAAVLAEVHAARGDIARAVRWSGRRARLRRGLGPLLRHAVLLLQAGQPGRALKAARAALAVDDTAVEARLTAVYAALAAGRPEEAGPLVAGLLALPFQERFAAPAAAWAARAGAPGWAAADGYRLVILGRATPLPPPRVLAAGRALEPVALEAAAAPWLAVAGPGWAAWTLTLPEDAGRLAVSVEQDGRPLTPAPLHLPVLPPCEGAAAAEGRTVTGWVRDPSGLLAAPAVRLDDGAGWQAEVTPDAPAPAGAPPDARGFTVALPAAAGTTVDVRVAATGRRLVGAPLLAVAPADRLAASVRAVAAFDAATPPPLPEDPALRALARDRLVLPIAMADLDRAPLRDHPPGPPADARVVVLVPVYRGVEETLACLRSVLAARCATPCKLLVVDDASPEPALVAALSDLEWEHGVTVLRNPCNLGFPGAVNRGLAQAAGRDVVLLNADTVVHDGWLDRLRAAAYGAPDVGTVTPFTNNGTILSYPDPKAPAEAPDPAAAAALDRAAARANAGLTVTLPTAIGFCMYIRHDCLSATGGLDAVTFSLGYGEENDFCLRARALGWRHVAAADVYVVHHGSVSFSAAKEALVARNMPLINARYPGYTEAILAFIKADPLAAARRQLDRARLLEAVAGRPVTLLVSLDTEGGLVRHVTERQAALEAAGRAAVVLWPGGGTAGTCRLGRGDPEAFPNLRYALPEALDELVGDLKALGVVRIELHHFMDHPPAVLELPARLGVPHEITVHDYAWICPQVTLMDERKAYCGEPEVAQCRTCVAFNGRRVPEEIDPAALRARSAALMRTAAAVVVPSRDGAARIARYAGPQAPVVVRPWEDDAALPPLPPRRPVTGRPVRVAVIGAIGTHKGFEVLLDCARDAARRGLPLRFEVVGFTENDPLLFGTGAVCISGPYGRSGDGVADLLAEADCDVAFLPSVWPETWCYALTEAWKAGLPVVAFDLGAVAERIRATGRGTLIPLGTPAAEINRILTDGTGTGG